MERLVNRARACMNVLLILNIVAVWIVIDPGPHFSDWIADELYYDYVKAFQSEMPDSSFLSYPHQPIGVMTIKDFIQLLDSLEDKLLFTGLGSERMIDLFDRTAIMKARLLAAEDQNFTLQEYSAKLEARPMTNKLLGFEIRRPTFFRVYGLASSIIILYLLSVQRSIIHLYKNGIRVADLQGFIMYQPNLIAFTLSIAWVHLPAIFYLYIIYSVDGRLDLLVLEPSEIWLIYSCLAISMLVGSWILIEAAVFRSRIFMDFNRAKEVIRSRYKSDH